MLRYQALVWEPVTLVLDARPHTDVNSVDLRVKYILI